MGVIGLTKELQERNVLPLPGHNANKNKKNKKNGNENCQLPSGVVGNGRKYLIFEQELPKSSNLLIDGNGLAFYLHSIAYARHVRNVSKCSDATTLFSKRSSNNTVGKISQLLPTLLPLSLLQQVTTEFVTTLLSQSSNQVQSVQIYWDGPQQRFKTITKQKRLRRRDMEWSMLYQYCHHGALSNYNNNRFSSSQQDSSHCTCSYFLYQYPLSNVFLATIKQTLQGYINKNNNKKRISMVFCNEEADVELARAATNDPTSFVLGQDSDFFIYKNIQYIPFDSLCKHKDRLYGSIMTRTKLALLLFEDFEESVHDSSIIIELALLCGNDYIDSQTTASLSSHGRKTIEQYLDYLNDALDDNGTVFKLPDTEENDAIRFVRCLYELQDLSDFPLKEEEDDDDKVKEILDFTPMQQLSVSDIIANGFNNSNYERIVSKCLQYYMQYSSGNNSNNDNNIDSNQKKLNSIMIEQEHVDAFLKSFGDNKSSKNKKSNSEIVFIPDDFRPIWKDVCAANFIETCMSKYFKLQQPGGKKENIADWNVLNFHLYLAQVRKQQAYMFDDGGDTPIQTATTTTTTTTTGESATATRKAPQDRMMSSSSSSNNEKVSTNNEETIKRPPPPPKRDLRPIRLPIDEHKHTILETIKNNRITIIHGETGCGKSSRVPCMILREQSPIPSLPEVKLFISQPRRIAAKSLVERVRSCEPDLSHLFALRMGHGWKEYETSQTQAIFVTTGYLTRLLANHPERFDTVTHLIIDEVHERSVDTDILCLLCKRLLQTNKKIRLVLMSATLATSLYSTYFDVPNPPIHVGVRRFPITEVYVEDLFQNNFMQMPNQAMQTAVAAIYAECEKSKCRTAPNANGMKQRVVVAARLATMIGKPGSAVLIFVPGMNEIMAITEEIEDIFVAGVRFVCIPIHSDIPFEDQLMAFEESQPDEVRIIIATNAAESSVTLPDVDNVICMGLCRQIIYNAASHRQMLVPCWISKASATQRAGRTGRVRPGNVYRLYSRNTYESYMDEFEPGEMVRIPLDAIILMLKEMLQEEQIVPVLLDCIEPPNTDTIDRSFQSLHHWDFITTPDDHGEITNLGTFVSSLGIDLTLGFLIGLGIQFGLAAEVIEVAATVSFPKTPFVMANPMTHEPPKYNQMQAGAFAARCHFDANLYSEPLGLMNMMWDYDMVPNKGKFCWDYNIHMPRLKQLVGVRNNLRKRVADYVGISEEYLRLETPPAFMSHAKLTLLRVLQVWVFSDNIIECSPIKQNTLKDGSVKITINHEGQVIQKEHFTAHKILDPSRHDFQIQSINEIEQIGSIDLSTTQTFVKYTLDDDVFETRLLSLALEKEVNALLFIDDDICKLCILHDDKKDDLLRKVEHLIGQDPQEILVAEQFASTKRRGLFERKCGAWRIREENDTPGKKADKSHRIWKYDCPIDGSTQYDLKRMMKTDFLELVDSVMICNFASSSSTSGKKKKKKKSSSSTQMFSFSFYGTSTKILKPDLIDLFGTHDFDETTISDSSKQFIVFAETKNRPILYKGQGKDRLAMNAVTDESSWNRPLFDDIPEGARVLSVVASGHRRNHFIQLPILEGEESGEGNTNHSDDGDDDDDGFFKLGLKATETCISKRWKRYDSDKNVYVPDNSVPSAATHTSKKLVACCSNVLEVRGGGFKVEGMTLLPPNPLFLLLSFLTFGLQPGRSVQDMILSKSIGIDNDSSGEDSIDEKVKTWIRWLQSKVQSEINSSKGSGINKNKMHSKVWSYLQSTCENRNDLAKELAKLKIDDNDDDDDDDDMVLDYDNDNGDDVDASDSMSKEEQIKQAVSDRIKQAIEFDEKCTSMGEELVCSADKVCEIVEIFNAVDGYEMTIWENLEEKSLTPDNLKKWRYLKKTSPSKPTKDVFKNRKVEMEEEKYNEIQQQQHEEGNNSGQLSQQSMQTIGTKNTMEYASSAAKSNNNNKPAMLAPSQALRKGNKKSLKNQDNKGAPKVQGLQEFSKTAIVIKKQHKPLKGQSAKFTPDFHKISKRMFAIDLQEGEQIDSNEIASTNILALLVRLYCDYAYEETESTEQKSNFKKSRTLKMTKKIWNIRSFKIPPLALQKQQQEEEEEEEIVLYQAKFCNAILPVIPTFGRGKNGLPKWMKKSRRPNTIDDAIDCIPPTAISIKMHEVKVKGEGVQLLFEDMETAVRMEAAFWLDHQFCHSSKSQNLHWYQHALDHMLRMLKKQWGSVASNNNDNDNN